MQHSVKQAAPISPLILADIYQMLDFQNEVDIVFWATILLGFFMMLRSSNLVPKSASSFSQLKQLSQDSIKFMQLGLVAVVKWSKTIQFRQKTLFIPIPAIPGSITYFIKLT